jgi:nuclear pore complex protein Nup85
LVDPKLSIPDRTIFFASLSIIPEPLLSLYTESYTLFTSLQRIVASSIRLPLAGRGLDASGFGIAEVWDKKGNLIGVESLIGPPGAETVGHMRRLVMMYLEELYKLRETEGLDVSCGSILWVSA